jgi:putative PIN family toxin of toxin-antitoxin system
VVIDTSSLVSYVLTMSELDRRVVAYLREGTFVLLSSPATRAELTAVLARPKIQRLAVEPLAEFARGMERFTEHVPEDLHLFGACRDLKDDKFLACAVEGKAHYLVSSDRDWLDMRRYQDVPVVNPGQFLLALELHEMDARAMARRFDRAVLADIGDTVPLEPITRVRILDALATPGDGVAEL